MRAIKFRGKSLKYGNWLYGSLWLGGDNAYIIHERPVEKAGEMMWHDTYVTEIDFETIGQYTGLKDANGKEIYEGDIISQNRDIIGMICFSSRYGFSVKKNSTTWSLVNFCVYSDFDSGILSGIEVIGNIHDNKYLTK